MVHNLDPLCPEEARQTDWAPWPPACKVIRQANNPQAIHKMLDNSTQKRSVFLLPEGASFPEIITWRTSVFPTSGGSLVLRPTGASGKGRHNVTKVRGLVLTPSGKIRGGRAVLYKQNDNTIIAFLPNPGEHDELFHLCRTANRVPSTVRLKVLTNTSTNLLSSSIAVVALGTHKVALVYSNVERDQLAVLKYDKSFDARFALRDNYGRKIFEAGPNKFYLPGGAKIYCRYHSIPVGYRRTRWSPIRRVLTDQPVTDAKAIDNWNDKKSAEHAASLWERVIVLAERGGPVENIIKSSNISTPHGRPCYV